MSKRTLFASAVILILFGTAALAAQRAGDAGPAARRPRDQAQSGMAEAQPGRGENLLDQLARAYEADDTEEMGRIIDRMQQRRDRAQARTDRPAPQRESDQRPQQRRQPARQFQADRPRQQSARAGWQPRAAQRRNLSPRMQDTDRGPQQQHTWQGRQWQGRQWQGRPRQGQQWQGRRWQGGRAMGRPGWARAGTDRSWGDAGFRTGRWQQSPRQRWGAANFNRRSFGPGNFDRPRAAFGQRPFGRRQFQGNFDRPAGQRWGDSPRRQWRNSPMQKDHSARRPDTAPRSEWDW